MHPPVKPCANPAAGLNLGTIRTDGSVGTDEAGLKKELLAKHETVCSEVLPGMLYLAGAKVAGSLAALRSAGITHIVNCVAMAQASAFPEDFKYLDLSLNGELASPPSSSQQ